jgi:hypothetical protein
MKINNDTSVEFKKDYCDVCDEQKICLIVNFDYIGEARSYEYFELCICEKCLWRAKNERI